MIPCTGSAIGKWGRMASRTRVWMWLAVASAALLLASCRAEEDAAASAAAAEEEPSFVLTLDSTNFSDAIAKHPFIVVEFYAPWCGHCKKLTPEYERAAATLSKHDPPIVLAKVDANDEINKELASKYEVKGFPTLKILKNEGKIVQEYKGPRDAEGIVGYLKKQVGPPSTELKSADDASTLFDEKKVYIVGLFSEFAGEGFENYMTVADILRSDYEFGHTLDSKFLPRGDASVKPPLVRLFKPFDELFVDFKDFHVDALQKFIEETSMPLVTMFTNDPANHPYVIKFFESDNAKALLFMNFSGENFENFKSIYHDVARNYNGKKISFLMGDLDASQGAFQYFGLKEEQAPLIIIQTNDGQKYLKVHLLEPAQLAGWVKDYMEGNVKPFIKSEPIPEVNNEPVKVVVADSLRDVVFNSGKNVLLEFYAPWCGHCQKLEPILEEAALVLQSDTDVIIAKMDATANDIPSDFEVQGYPALYFRSASGKLVQYDGGRTKEDIVDFIQKNRDPVVESESIKDEL